MDDWLDMRCCKWPGGGLGLRWARQEMYLSSGSVLYVNVGVAGGCAVSGGPVGA